MKGLAKTLIALLIVALAGVGALNMFITTRTYAAIDHLQETKLDEKAHTKEHEALMEIMQLTVKPIADEQHKLRRLLESIERKM
jgi:flagellar basal body-associated protein FliL